MTKSQYRRSLVGLITFLGLCLAMVVFLLHASGESNPLGKPRTLQAMLPDASNLASKADVRMGGLKVGKVDGVRTIGRHAAIEMQLDEGVGPIYRNARVQVRYKSALNEGYVDLSRGGGQETRTLPSGGVLPLSSAEETVQVDKVLDTLDKPTRRHLQGTLDGLGGGLKGQGDHLNDLFESVGTTVNRGTPVFRTLAGQRDDTGRLIDDFGQVADALGSRATALRVLAQRARTTSEIVAARDNRVRESLAELPSTATQADRSATRLGTLSQTATPVLGDMRAALTDLQPAIRKLRPAAATTRDTVRQLRGFIPQADPLLARLRPFAVAGRGLTRPLDSTTRQTNPLVEYLASQKRNIVTFFPIWTGATDSIDASGHLNKLSFLVNKEALRAVLPPSGVEALNQLENAGVLSALGGKVQRNPYPKEGDVGDPKPFTGSYPRLQALPTVLKGSP